ncbi:hypothetical protein GCM10011519_23370 [Marmoricola endophyticus]|uniref:DUF218 domain-containing protein n=1 Tax=Marmoricola endophyticus TaxID=2040280 RepID=A0A917F3A5_9ACTN|nr:ElyC/SanA/YdcF family protein [Marmoricola endophyticus]GGF48671.1 hypothetical protein GCM10011519_23370 [Marmoricola endophyticus]
MNDAIGSAVLAVVYTVPLLVVLFVPYVAWSYRARGQFGVRAAMATAAGVLWVVALWAYTVLPVPSGDPCRNPVRPQLRPFAFLGDLTAAPGPGLLRDPALLQVALNVALFVPLGVGVALLVRRRRVAVGALVGLGVSLSVELVQLTGTLGVFDCAYRLFDVDDLIANTAGAALGALAGPLARRVVGSRRRAPVSGRPVTATRRFVAGAVDVFVLLLVSLVLLLGGGAVRAALAGGTVEQGTTDVGASVWLDVVPGALLLLVLPVLTRGRTVGRWATSVRPVTPEHRRPGPLRTLAHSLGGLGGLWLLWTVRERVEGPVGVALGLVGLVWVVLSLVLIVRGDHRGLSGRLTGMAMVDSRDLALLEHDRGSGRRRPLLTVRAVSLLAFAAYVGLLAALRGLNELGGTEGIALLAPVLGTLVASQVVAAGYLVGNGLVMLRKEGRSLGNLLSLLAGLGAAALVVVGAGVVLTAGEVLRTVVLVVSVLVSYAATVFIALVLVGRGYGRTPTTGDVDVVVVLGSRVVRGRVPPLLRARLETAERVREETVARGGDPWLVCSGAQGRDEEMSEGRAMVDWLAGHGTPADRLVAEEQARTTSENLRLSLALAQERGAGRSPVVVTNGYHVFRAALLAEDLDLDVRVAAGPTAPYFLPSALLREHVAVLRRTRWLQVVLAVALATATLVASLG